MFTMEDTSEGYTVTVESEELDGLEVDVSVSLPDNVEPTEVQKGVVTEYAGNVETFIRKNVDYGSSFSTGPKIESLFKYGEVREEEIPNLMARQIFIRGFLDKISRFYNVYIDGDETTVDEDPTDTLLDLANYAIMLTSQIRRHGDDQ